MATQTPVQFCSPTSIQGCWRQGVLLSVFVLYWRLDLKFLPNSNMQALTAEFNKILTEYSIATEAADNAVPASDEQAKKLRKKLKKNIVDPKEDDLNTAVDKFNRMLEGLNKSYEGAVKAESQYSVSQDSKEALNTELNKEQDHKKRLESLHANFMKKYNEELKAAQTYEVEETENKKKYTEELQGRIKIIQEQFEESGKRKIESIRENEISKEEVNRLKSHLEASEALVDAQLRKKGLEIDIQMSTLKQKIEMIESLKNHGAGASDKLEKAGTDSQKIDARLKVFSEKEEEHKMAITKAHLLIEDYKASILKIREMLEKLSSESEKLNHKCRKSEQALKSSKEEENRLKLERDTQVVQMQGLKNLENTLKEQLKKL